MSGQEGIRPVECGTKGGSDPWVGLSVDGSPIEVMTYINPPHDVVVFHCMQLRDKFRRLMEGETR
ncbi:hypothetical protein V6584_00620 [Bifidobacterium sp. IMAU50987]